MDARFIQYHISPKVTTTDDSADETQQSSPQNGVNLEFVANNQYLAEDLRGIMQFRREQRRKLHHIVDQFNEYYQWNLDKTAELEGTTENFGALENLNDAIKYLVSLLKNDFLVPGKLELTAVHLIGDFSVYQPGDDSPLKRQAGEIRAKSIQEFQQKHHLEPVAPAQQDYSEG
ncbi:protein-tyrosine phosphatase family protein [Limosilactobacillus caecicola]|uniref:hypothetical protein n=1 Tax=Limosilactobacillus caecicola TaxID=2941332 RepID=UPI00203DC57E|nr:hypothetical protein [Limosilactobacillus caecicola]